MQFHTATVSALRQWSSTMQSVPILATPDARMLTNSTYHLTPTTPCPPGRHPDGSAEAVHAGGDGAGADGAEPVQGAVHGTPGGRQVGTAGTCPAGGGGGDWVGGFAVV